MKLAVLVEALYINVNQNQQTDHLTTENFKLIQTKNGQKY